MCAGNGKFTICFTYRGDVTDVAVSHPAAVTVTFMCITMSDVRERAHACSAAGAEKILGISACSEAILQCQAAFGRLPTLSIGVRTRGGANGPGPPGPGCVIGGAKGGQAGQGGG